MQIIFVHHSCFLVEVVDKVLIFDYFDGDKVDGWHYVVKWTWRSEGMYRNY